MKLTVINMNEDDSANCEIDLTNEELIFFAKIGIIKALEDAIKEKRIEDEN